MSATELQACLARLYTSWAFRSLFRADPDAALDGYFLTAREREAISGIDWDTLDWFAASLKTKRRSRLEKAFPALFAIGGPTLDTYVDRYHEVYPLRPGETGSDDAAQFGAFIEETLADDEHLPAYARELARFERTLQEVRRSFRTAGTAAGDPPPESNGLPTRPEPLPGVLLARFDYNVSEIDDAVREGREPAPRDEGEVVVYALREGIRDPRVLRVSEPTAVVIELCDGRRSVDEITLEIEERYGQAGLRAGIEDAIGQLVASGILREGDEAA
jgi:Coenzyme PQQ synthesis protein D (PqqD)